MVGVALSSSPIGLDIERIQDDAFGVAAFFAPSERALFTTEVDKATLFTTMWAMKEAYGKRSGQGIQAAVLQQAIFQPEQTYRYEGQVISVLKHNQHIIAVCGKRTYSEQTIELVRSETLLQHIDK